MYVLSTLSLIVSYFLRLAHSETKQDIKDLKNELKQMSENQSKLEIKQNQIEKSIEKEIIHIREIMDSKLKSIEENIEKLVERQ